MRINSFREQLEAGALFAVLHSGGKDSQAMFIRLRELIPLPQLVVVHAVLDEVEWPGSEEHIRKNIGDVPLLLARPASTFFEMVERQGRFPSPKNRQCTSDLKRTPNEREIRRYLAAHPEYGGRVVVCMGMRAGESSARSRLNPWKRSERNSLAGRQWFEWLPIHDLTETEVFSAISAAGEAPHWVYAAGMSRKSCCFCIMSSLGDLRTAARLAPLLYRRYASTERRLNFALSMSGRFLPDLTGVPA